MGDARLLRFVAAYAGSTVSEWASWLAVLVYAEQRGGSAAAGWAALALLVPAVVVAPFVNVLADGTRPIRSLTSVYGIQGVACAASALLAAAGAPLVAVTIPAAVAIGGIAYVRPAYAIVAPALVRSARELTRASLAAGYCDSGAVLAGPIVATAFLAAGGPEAVLFACAGLALVGVVATATLWGHDRPPEAAPAEDDTPRLREVLGSLRRHPTARALLTVLGTQHLLMGFIGPMFVILAADVLHMGSSGAGALNIAFGVGALTSAASSTVLAGRPRIAPVVAVCLALVATTLFLVGGLAVTPVVMAGLLLGGAGRSLLDVTARMLLQRSAPPRYLAGVFAFIEVLTSVGLALGTALAQLSVATVGARWGFVLMGAVPVAVLAATGRTVWRADQAADVPVVAIALLRSNPVFGPLPPPALESAARAAEELHVAAGTELIAQGDVGDAYYLVSSGALEVVRDGAVVARLTRGEGAGEVALLADVPRTAAVVVAEAGVVLRIAREPFLVAVTGHGPSRDAAWRQVEQFLPRP